MAKKSSLLSKTLVVAVIVLFIGVGIQPALADVSYTTVSDSDEDCNLCPKVSNLHLVRLKSLLYRLEKYDNLLSVTGKMNIKDVAFMMNIDITSTTFWENSLKLIENDIENFINLK